MTFYVYIYLTHLSYECHLPCELWFFSWGLSCDQITDQIKVGYIIATNTGTPLRIFY